jgi:hypothetical protein
MSTQKQTKRKSLTAHQLAAMLLDLPDFPILLSQDSESNAYYDTTKRDIAIGRFEQTDHGYYPIEDLSEQDLHPKMNSKNVCIVLFPNN